MHETLAELFDNFGEFQKAISYFIKSGVFVKAMEITRK